MCNIIELPTEILRDIAEYLPQLDKLNYTRTSKRLRDTEEVLFRDIELNYQNSPQVLSLVRTLCQCPAFLLAIRTIEIDASALQQGGEDELSYDDRHEAEHLSNSLAQLTVPLSTLGALEISKRTKKKWLLNWMTEKGYLSACLAWIILKAKNLTELRLDVTGFLNADILFELLYWTHSIGKELGHPSFARMQRLEMVLSGKDAYIPLVPALTEVVLIQPGIDIIFSVPGIQTSDATSLRVIDLRGSLDGARKITELLRTGAPPNLEEILIEDETLDFHDIHSKLFDLIFEKLPKIHTLVTIFRSGPDGFDVATIVPPKASQMETLTYFGIHQLLIPNVGPGLDLRQLQHSVPPNVKELDIEGLTVDSIQHVVDSYKNHRYIPMRLPDHLETLYLSFDVNAQEFASPKRKLASIRSALRALSRQLAESGRSLRVYVRNMDSDLPEEILVSLW